jgi:hypothetical protein
LATVSAQAVHEAMPRHCGRDVPQNMRAIGFHSHRQIRDVYRTSARRTSRPSSRSHRFIAAISFGVATPNSDQCALRLDGVDYPWFDGEELLFDQTYLHSAFNRTEIPRVILFCDVEKTQLRGVIKRFADMVDYAVVAKFTGADDKGKLSWLSWAYKPIYKVRSYVKQQLKPRSLIAYKIVEFGSIALLIFLLYSLFGLVSHLL